MRSTRRLALAVLFGCAYALGALLTIWYFNTPKAGAAFFPSAGLTLAMLLLTPRRTWPLWLAAVAVAEISIDLVHGETMFMAVGFAAANIVEPLLAATLIAIGAGHLRDGPRSYLLRYVACAVVIGPFVGGLIGGTVVAIATPSGFVSTSAAWWLGDGLGVLVVATPVLAWRRRGFYPVSSGIPEMVAFAAFAVAITVVPSVFFNDSFAYIAAALLMVAAIRGGPLAVGISGLGLAFGASWVVASGHGYALLNVNSTHNALIDTQLFIGVTVLAALVLAVEVAERTRAELALARSETERIEAELAGLHAAAAERGRIAREIHDIVGHALNVMILSGAAARRVLDGDPLQAKELLATVEDVGRDAFRDLDIALGLTDQSPDFTPLKGLADLDELVARLARAGMRVDYQIEGAPRPLPRLVDGSAFRIIQESLTNVAKHAADAPTHVHVRFAPTTLQLEVSNGIGRADGPKHRAGRGSVGMRERVAVLGGHIETGPNAGGGYSVTAELPLEPV